MDITRWSIPKSDLLYSLQPKMKKLYIVSKNKTGSWLWLRSWTPYFQIQTQIEESKENHSPFSFDLNQIPYNYTMKVTNRFKGLDPIDRVPKKLWMEVPNIVQEVVTKTIPKKKKCKKAKRLWGVLTNSWAKRSKRQRKTERYTHLNAAVQRIERRDKKSLPQWSM